MNQQWKVLNYEKAKDLGDPISSSSKGCGRVERNSSHTNSRQRTSRHVRTFLNHHCGYTILHIISQLRPNNLHSSNQEVVMRVTTVWSRTDNWSLLGFIQINPLPLTSHILLAVSPWTRELKQESNSAVLSESKELHVFKNEL